MIGYIVLVSISCAWTNNNICHVVLFKGLVSRGKKG